MHDKWKQTYSKLSTSPDETINQSSQSNYQLINLKNEECLKYKADTGFYNYNFVRQFADFTDFIKYVETKINISSYDNMTLPKEIDHDDATMDTQDDSTPINRKRKNTDNVTLPEKIRFLQTFYFIIRNSNSHALFVNPYQFCSVGVKRNGNGNHI
ncbi:unnamed protein product [Macrosiphum euphorbiae]|uniref:Uncharacterized protein n=1 Tax=Macrosiphum euphorbiae TaxID=13131 RepID=A0AAV0VM19_9HEMI|nr:unnamed protein product [Macrosiphum euphorbiae]